MKTNTKTNSPTWDIFIVWALLICDFIVNHFFGESRGFTHGLRGLTIFVCFFYSATSARRPQGAKASNTLTYLSGILVTWIIALTLLHAPEDFTRLIEPLRFVYWYSVFIFFATRITTPKKIGASTSYSFILFYFCCLFAFNEVILNRTASHDHIGVNAIFPLLACYPITLISKNRTYRLLTTVLTTALAILSVKRGGILAMALMLVSYGIAERERIFTLLKKYPLKAFLFFSFGLIVLSTGIYYAYQSSIKAIEKRFAFDNDLTFSGRTFIIEDLLDRITEFNVQEILFGLGPLGTLEINGLYAHNDFLQLTVDYGFLACFLYLGILIAVFRLYRKHRIRRSFLTPAIATAGALMFSRGLTGGHINYPEMAYTCVVLGIASNQLGTE